MHPSTQLIIIRHGETDWNVDGRLQGQADIPLNSRGVEQAQLLAGALLNEPIDVVCSSDLSRASQTAQILAQAKGMNVNINLHAEQGMRERHFGGFQGQTFAQIEVSSPEGAKRWKERDLDYIPQKEGEMTSQGESLNQFFARVKESINQIAAQHPERIVAVLTHGGVLDILYRMGAGINMQAARTWSLGNTSINRFSWAQGQLKLISWGDVSHLASQPLSVHGEPTDLEPTSVEPSAKF